MGPDPSTQSHTEVYFDLVNLAYNTQNQKLHWHQLQSRLSDYHGTSSVEQLSETREFPFGIFS